MGQSKKYAVEHDVEAMAGELLFYFGVTMRGIALSLDTASIRQGHLPWPKCWPALKSADYPEPFNALLQASR
jgi:hypothetical protein